VLCCAWAANGRLLGSGDHAGQLVVWDALTSEQRLVVRGHQAPVHALAFSPNSRSLASASADKTVRVWSVLSGGELQLLIRGHAGGVNAVEFDAAGKMLASSSLEEKAVRVWDAVTGSLLCVIANAALCAPGAFAMYSLARHAPCVRTLAFKPRTSNSITGAAPAGVGGIAGRAPRASGTGERPSPASGGGAAGAAAFGRLPSFTLSHLLQPSMTMKHRESGGLPGAGTSMELNYTFLQNSGGGGGDRTSIPGAVNGGSPGGPSLATAPSIRTQGSDDPGKMLELASEADNPIVPIYTQFVTPTCVAVAGKRIVLSDGPFLSFYESSEGRIVGWNKNRTQSAAASF
jgi:hypothetical protein